MDKEKEFQSTIFCKVINKQWTALLPNNETLLGKQLNKLIIKTTFEKRMDEMSDEGELSEEDYVEILDNLIEEENRRRGIRKRRRRR